MTNKKIILIAGGKRHGKDTVANILASKLSNTHRLAYAEPMKAVLAETLGLTLDELEEYKNNEEYKHREYLQRFGQSCKRYFGENCWGNIVEHTINNLPSGSIAVLSDFRMPVEYIEGALTIQVTNPRVHKNDAHISETALGSFGFDITVINDGTLEELEAKVEDIIKKLYSTEWLT